MFSKQVKWGFNQQKKYNRKKESKTKIFQKVDELERLKIMLK
jgi:hypothetical protein